MIKGGLKQGGEAGTKCSIVREKVRRGHLHRSGVSI